jgi:hypothetical protein
MQPAAIKQIFKSMCMEKIAALSRRYCLGSLSTKDVKRISN